MNRVWKLKAELEFEERTLQGMRETGIRITPSYSERCTSGNNDSPVENLVLRITEKEKQIEKLKISLSEAMTRLEEKISELVEERRARQILLFRYVDCMKFGDISRILNYSEKHIRRLHKKAKTELLERRD